MPRSFGGHAVVITGAASGIGRALAERFGRGGARVALLDRDAEGLAAVASRLSVLGVDVLELVCDVTSQEQCEAAMDSVVAAWGGVNVLINNAGITHLSPFSETDVGVYRRLMDVNFFGAVHCSKAALGGLLKRKGIIVVISSVAGFAPLAMRSGYAASKHALHGFFETVRTELEPRGLSVLMVCPGFTRTAIEKSALAGDGQLAHVHRSTVGKKADPAEVAEAVYVGVLHRRRLLVLSPVGKLSYLISRAVPALYERLMVGSLARDEKRAGAQPR